MAPEAIRIGIVGAGANTRRLHIPNFQKIDGVEVVSVVNRSRESSERVAREFNIPHTYASWQELVAADDSNAIMIGTWPYLHCPVTLAALAAGKHVLTEARMAMNAAEAREMLAASRRQPAQVAMVVPSPFTFAVDATIQSLIAEGYLGRILAVDLRAGGGFVDETGPLTWRQDGTLSGDNIMYMGIWCEALMRWVGEAARVTAMGKVAVPMRFDPERGHMRSVRIPEHVEVVAEMACGAIARMQVSAIAGLAPAAGVWLYGSEGTLHYDHEAVRLEGGHRGDRSLREIAIAPENRGTWRVEEEFAGAIRGTEPVRRTSFEDGVRYMDFTSAVVESLLSGASVALPTG